MQQRSLLCVGFFASCYVALLSFLLISFVCLKKLTKWIMQNLVSFLIRVCFFYSFSVGWIIFSARRQKMSAFLEFSCPIYWTKCIFSWQFFLFRFWFEMCGLLAFYALHKDMYNEDSWCFVHGLLQAAVGRECSLGLFVHCSNMCVRWFFWSMALKCVLSVTVLWLWFALIN